MSTQTSRSRRQHRSSVLPDGFSGIFEDRAGPGASDDIPAVNTTHVLWTGGWDSTYRVLELALVKGVRVQPHYLTDPDRESSGKELEAIEAIRSAAIERGGAIEPLHVQPIEDVAIPEDAAEKHRQLAGRFHIGPQYLWLSEYARQSGIEDLELSVHYDDRAHSVCVLLQSLEDANEGLITGQDASPENLFRFFSFPLLDLSKVRMRELAQEHGFDDLMELTWFCHQPTRSGKPCGFCNPCHWTLEEGLGNRLPTAARLRGHVGRGLVPRLPGFRVRRAVRRWLRALG